MYLYSFMNNLTLLRRPHVCQMEELNGEQYLCYGMLDRDAIPEEQRPRLPKDGKSFIAYTSFDTPLILNYLCADKYLEYIDQLKNVNADLTGLSDQELSVGMFEAVWLYEELSVLKEQHFTDVPLEGLETLEGLYQDNVLEPGLSVLAAYDNNIVMLKIIEAQFCYFVMQYLKARYHLPDAQQTDERFQKLLKKTVSKVMAASLLYDYKAEKITKEPNEEFDCFVAQIKDWVDHEKFLAFKRIGKRRKEAVLYN